MIKMEFKNRHQLRIKIAESGKSLRVFSKEIGVSQPYLSQLLNGTHNPSPTVSHKIARGLGLEVEDIFLIKVIDKSIKKASI